MVPNKRIAVIGAGFSGLSAAAYLAAAGHSVDVFEKHSGPGGRARQFTTDDGYTFDMGPSWYWMPDVYERWFGDFGYTVADWYRLKLLDPAFEMVFDRGDSLVVPDEFGALCRLFEEKEEGAGLRLEGFLREARYKYETAMGSIIYQPGHSPLELVDRRLIAGARRFQLFSSIRSEIRRHFRHPQLIALMEFPILFLGAMPADTPALYTLMNHAGLSLGTWYPKGGFGAVARAVAGVAEKQGVRFHYGCAVERILVGDGKVTGLAVGGEVVAYDAVVASADYHYVETQLLPAEYANYNERYWERKVFAPSCLIFYLGVGTRVPELRHHTLFFDEDLDRHAAEIYRERVWPEKPLFYVCRSSASDAGVAPAGCENLFLLLPLANGLVDTPATREHYYQLMMERVERRLGREIHSFVQFKRSYCINDMISDYGAYKGNAYGLANTLWQTAFLKPKMRNRRLPNLAYTGQLTVPGPGVPPALISGKIAAGILTKSLKNNQ